MNQKKIGSSQMLFFFVTARIGRMGEGNVLTRVCLSICLSVCLSTRAVPTLNLMGAGVPTFQLKGEGYTYLPADGEEYLLTLPHLQPR